jgi:hypothetical protein
MMATPQALGNALGAPSWLPQTITQGMISNGPSSGAGFMGGQGGTPNYSLNLGQGGPGQVSIDNYSPGTNFSVGLPFGPAMTQGSADYTFNPQTNSYSLSKYGAPQKSDAGGWQDKLTQAATIAAMMYGGGLAANSVMGAGAASGAGSSGGSYLDTPIIEDSAFSSASPGLSSGFSSAGQYVDPLYGGSPGAGIPGATGTLDASAPITGSSLLSGSPGAAGLGASLTNADKLKLAKNLLSLGQNMATGQQTKVNNGVVSSGVGGTIAGGGLSGNLKMLLEANAQAKLNGQPLPFPGLGGMGT